MDEYQELLELEGFINQVEKELEERQIELQYNIDTVENNPTMTRPGARRKFEEWVRQKEFDISEIERLLRTMKADRNAVWMRINGFAPPLEEEVMFAPSDSPFQEEMTFAPIPFEGEGIFGGKDAIIDLNAFNKKAHKGVTTTQFLARQIGRHVLGTVPPNKKKSLNTGLVGIHNPTYEQYQKYY